MVSLIKSKPHIPSKRRGLGTVVRLLACSVAMACSLHAQATGRYVRAELSKLPPYCADSELSTDYDRGGPKWQYWVSRMGGLFNSIHHYCEGMLNVEQARRMPTGSQGQTALLKKAISEYDFMLNSGADRLKTFPLLPEVLIRKAEIGVLMENWQMAYAAYEEARRVKPDYWPAYTGWAEVLVKLNLKKDALALLKQGLLINPTAEPMRQMYAKVGGNLAEIPNELPKPAEAVAPAASAPDPAVADAASAPDR